MDPIILFVLEGEKSCLHIVEYRMVEEIQKDVSAVTSCMRQLCLFVINNFSKSDQYLLINL